jgi:hypothetical protein
MPSPHRRSSRPTTPLRRIERGSLSALSQSRNSASGHASDTPLELLDIGFSELADAFSDLNANMQQIVGLGQDISRFNESFASFLYGLNVNAFCVDFPEVSMTVLANVIRSHGCLGSSTRILQARRRKARVYMAARLPHGHKQDWRVRQHVHDNR